jgi:hypothetical protein
MCWWATAGRVYEHVAKVTNNYETTQNKAHYLNFDAFNSICSNKRLAGEEMHAATNPESRVYSPYGTRDVRDYAPHYRKVQPAKEINKNFSHAHRMIDLREAHMKLDPLQDTYPKREEDIRRFISTS